jgi:hypothetical protein
MVKSIEDLTINDHDLVERTGGVDHLRKWFNFLPAKWFEKRIAELLKEVLALFSAPGDDVFEETQWAVQSFIIIERIRLNYYGVYNILGNRFNLNYQRNRFGIKKKITKNTSLQGYIATLKELTGIEVKKPKDLKAVLKDLEFKQDKYQENHVKKKSTGEPTPFMTTVINICLYMGTSFEGNMKLTQFATLQDVATKKYLRERNG